MRENQEKEYLCNFCEKETVTDETAFVWIDSDGHPDGSLICEKCMEEHSEEYDKNQKGEHWLVQAAGLRRG